MPCALLLLLIVLCLQEAGSCLHCDRSFLEALEALLGEVVPPTVPQRDTLIQHHIEAFTQLYTLHLREKQHRVLGGLCLGNGQIPGWAGICGA